MRERWQQNWQSRKSRAPNGNQSDLKNKAKKSRPHQKLMTHLLISGGRPLTGRCQVPGDKSISHRAVMFSAIANGVSTVRGFLDGGDCFATIEVMRGLGVKVEERSSTELVIHGRGLDGLQEPS